jgi:hypothetical protein
MMAKKLVATFPKALFVRADGDDFIAYATQTAAVEDDGPTEVARYELVEVKQLEKVVQESHER